jgi:hypothetical protein
MVPKQLPSHISTEFAEYIKPPLMSTLQDNQLNCMRMYIATSIKRANIACTGCVGFVAIFKQFSRFGYFLFPGIVHARPHASNANR